MKILKVFFIFGLIQMSASDTDSGTSTDPAPGRSPGPPDMKKLRETHSGDTAHNEPPPTLLSSKDEFLLSNELPFHHVSSSSGYDSIINSPYIDDSSSNKNNDDVDRNQNDDDDDDEHNNVKTTNAFNVAGKSTQFSNTNTINIDLNSRSNSNINKKLNDGQRQSDETNNGDNNVRHSTSLAPCMHVNDDDYIKMSDSVIKIEKNNVKQNLFDVDVSHDVFDTANGLLPGIIYTVELTFTTPIAKTTSTVTTTTSSRSTTIPSHHHHHQQRYPNEESEYNEEENTNHLDNLQDLYIETTNNKNNEPYGHFIGINYLNRPTNNPLWSMANRDTEWLSPSDRKKLNNQQPAWGREDYTRDGGKLQKAKHKNQDGYDKSNDSTNNVRNKKNDKNKRQIWDGLAIGDKNKQAVDGDQSMMSNDCVNNVWYQKNLRNEKIHLKWILDSDGNVISADENVNNITIKFRVRLKDVEKETVYEMSILFPIIKDCKLYLKHSSGSLNSSFLTAHRKDCVIYFPSRDISPEPPPGLLIHLTRLNIPCSTGGYLKFHDHNTIINNNINSNYINNKNSNNSINHNQYRLCGKLEEFSLNERTFYFPSHNQTSVTVTKHPLFSLNYKLVDYCYNMTLSDRRRTFLLQPQTSLECYFKIHLPFGNRIAFDMITNSDNNNNNKNISSSSVAFNENDNNRTTNDTREYIDLSMVAASATSTTTTSHQLKSDSKNFISQCDGILIQISNMGKHNQWTSCVNGNSPMKFYSILSDTNILVIKIVKSLSASLDNQKSSSLSPLQRVPSLYMEYNAHPVESLVSQCAFGWIALSQFCITAIEKAVHWRAAESECNEKGGHLASIRSENDQKLLDQLLLNSPGYRDNSAYWIGATDTLYEGDFRWTDSLPFTFSNWFSGYSKHANYNKQPNDDGLSGQDCVEIRRQFHLPPGLLPVVSSLFGTYMWNDRNCDTKNYFICERPIIDEPIEKQWENDCNKTILLTRDRPKTSVWSPGFPRQYPDNINCFTFITVPTGFRIVLEFEELVIENEPQCDYDYLEIFEPEQMNVTTMLYEHRKNSYGYRTSRHSLNKIGMRKNMYPNGYSAPEMGNFLFDPLQSTTLIFQPLSPSYSRSQPPPNFHKGEVPRKMCGDWSSKLKLLRHVTKSATLGLHFVSDYSHHFGGFKARASMENVATECADERLKSYNGSCYLFVSYPEVDWLTAQQVCRGIDGQLASISTSDEQRFVTANVRNHVDYTPRSFYWLGGELSVNFGFEWTDGTAMAFQGWLPGQEPDLRKAKNPACLGLQWKASPTPMLPSGLYWSMQKCSTNGGYVCKTKRQDNQNTFTQNQTLTGSEGRFVSPGFPNFYPSNVDYWIRIVGPERTRLIIQFQKINIEQQDECLYDYISLQDIDLYPYLSSIELETDANQIPLAIFGNHQQKNVHYDEEYQNDEAEQQQQPPSAPPPSFLSKEKISKLEKRKKRELYGNHNPTIGSRSNLVIKNKFDKFTNALKSLIEKKESFETRMGMQHQLMKRRIKRFLKGDEQQKPVSNDNKIGNQFFIGKTMMNGHHEMDVPSFLPYARWCGNHDANMSKYDFISSTNEAILHFHSDYSITAAGFSATWNSIDISGCPFQTLTSREGVVQSPNYPHFLLNNLECTFILQAPLGKKVWLEFEDFEIFRDTYVDIDLGSGGFRPFQTDKHINDGAFVSMGESLKIRIRTGNEPRGKGFKAIYKTTFPIVEERVITLKNNTNGVLLQLNYPKSPPNDVEYTQHLIAPLGDVIIIELTGVSFTEDGCEFGGSVTIYDNYADSNGTVWHLCQISEENIHETNRHFDRTSRSDHQTSRQITANYKQPDPNTYAQQTSPIFIISYLNTLHIRQKTGMGDSILNATIRTQFDTNYKQKLKLKGDDWVESCLPNPCLHNGKCISYNKRKVCQCNGHFTGRFCGLNLCEVDQCSYGKCELTSSSFKCHCQPGYKGPMCDQPQKPCSENPCEGRGECVEKNAGYICRCYAWWEGARCEKRMMHIPYKPLTERMLQEPFWLGLITVFVVLAVIGLVWCAKRHFPEKIEKLLAEEASRNRPHSMHSHHTSLREQMQASAGGAAASLVIPTPTVTTPGAPRSIFGRLGIRKPSILSLSSPQPPGGSTARTFSLDDLLRPPPRRTPSPRKKRNNSTPTKKNAAEKKQILQQLVSPAANTKNKANLIETIQMNENRSKLTVPDVEINVDETTFVESPAPVIATLVRPISDPKLEKKVTFARLLSKVSAEMSSGSDVDLGNVARNSSALSLPVEVTHRANSVPPSPCTNDMRSPHSTSSNQGSGSLSSSELALNDFGFKANRRIRSKVSSADSILAMFKNFASSNAAINLPSSIILSPSTTPTASSPQDDVAGDDESSTSSIHTPVSYSSGAPDSPLFYRQSNNNTIEVPVLDQISAHKITPSLLHPPTILLEIPSSGINNKCLSPIREMPTPIPSPAITPIMPRPQRTRTPSPIPRDETMSIMFSDDDDKHNEFKSHHIIIDMSNDSQKSDSDLDLSSSKNSSSDSTRSVFPAKNPRLYNRVPAISISIDIEPPSPDRIAQRPRDLIIPQVMVQEPSPTKSVPPPPLIICPGSPPPQRSFTDDTHFVYPNRPTQLGQPQTKRLLKQQFEKPTSLDLPFAPPMITITTNMSEVESSDAECMSPGPNKTSSSSSTLGLPSGGMCYLSPFSMCGRGERAPSESNLSSSGYSSMASPGPSRCGSSNPLFPNETEDPGPGPPGPHFGIQSALAHRRHTSILKKCQQSADSSSNNTTDGNRERRCSDSETLSDDLLHESNDEGIGTDHIDEKIEDGEIKSAKELEVFIVNEMVEKGKTILSFDEPLTMAQLQLPAIVIQSEAGTDKLSPVSSRSESPMSERTTGVGSFSPYFYGKKDQQLPFTDSDGLYDFPSSDGRGSGSIPHRKSIGRRRERRSSKAGIISPSKSSVHLELPIKEQNIPHTKHHQQLTPTRKSPKRRPIPKYPVVVSSSSSTESITSAKEILPRGSKIFTITHKKTNSTDAEEVIERGLSCPNIPKPSLSDVTVPSRKISRLRAIGHQIRFLRRLEKSLKRRNHTISPSDSCPEDNVELLDSPKASSPLLQSSNPNKQRINNKICRQKRINYKQAFESKSSWPERTTYSIYSEFNSD